MSVTVIGAVFLDCKAFAPESYNPAGRNIGRIQFKHGGVARNVAENIARLGRITEFVSSVDRSPLGSAVVERLKEDKVNVSYLSYDSGMGIWSVILDSKGKQLGSISDLPELSAFESHFDSIVDEVIKNCDSIALELDFSISVTLKTLETAKKYGKKVYGVVANLGILEQLKDNLCNFEFIICNDIEAGKIFDFNTDGISHEILCKSVSEKLGMYGLSQIIVTMGEKGSAYINNDGQTIFVPSKKVTPVDTTGAGDAYFSGVVASIDKGLDIRKAMEVGTRLASQTICVDENTCIPSNDIFERL